jgi:methylated-DNA-[protein]-cysteine S-methyltransferase
MKTGRVSAFNIKVWAQCLKIPEGEVRTYKWLAEKIGHPKAYRAVGNALASNPFAPAVPCHRVIRSDGSPGGYSGGVKKKIVMLEKEKRRKSKYNMGRG